MNTRVLTRFISLTLTSLPFMGVQAQPSASASSSSTAQPTEPRTASSPHQRDLTSKSATEVSPTPGANPDSASTPHQREVTTQGAVEPGMPVHDSSGHPLGSVSKMLPGSGANSEGYVLIATPDGTTTPMPTPVANSMAVNGRIIIRRAALEGAPKVNASDLNAHDTSWQKKSDQYWARHGG